MNSRELQFSVLASGSTGNAVYVQAGDTKILIDAGIGIRQLQASCSEIGVDLTTLDAVLVTHEHSDHVRGLASLLRKVSVPIYTSQGTWSKIASFWREEEQVMARMVRANVAFSLGELVLEPFSLSHDAEEPLGFCVYGNGRKFVLATDLGYASDHVKALAYGADVYVLEANHDVELLRAGPYPWHLKRRILGDKGHLSNDSASDFLRDVLTDDARSVFLAHLSQENNRPELAHRTVQKAIADLPVVANGGLELNLTYPDRPTPLLKVSEANRISQFKIKSQ
ncbi:MBL fold metallo-hydrolase [Sulfoacidibacillus thermotolerans]|uniref:Metallo-beta-lactamase domain-containing protein n=1 Tax=Sulfoacidibacillus thermotolerans TaxID=1765684 RepID=A0A2U3D9I2_SULT2|nr:MBL fold metallo-hydrolase [Sulfoacidibacillus thermotolerans]PWI57931.1 hypothetical protein BM613_05830 [Sulfoacidibacillus thermotolerans]